MKNQAGHSEGTIEDYHKRTNEDYKKLPKCDKKIIDRIDELLKNLSEDGQQYWETYYS